MLLYDLGLKRIKAKDVYFSAWRFHRKSRTIGNHMSGSIDWMAKNILLKYFPLDLCVRIYSCWTENSVENIYKEMKELT